MVDNCFQCSHCQVCFLRIGIDNLLDEGHHKQISGGKAVLKNSVSLRFFRLLAEICKKKSRKEQEG